MVSVLVNDGVLHRIIVFEGNKEIQSKLLDWMQAGETKTRVSRRNTKKKAKASSSNSDASNSKNSQSIAMDSTQKPQFHKNNNST